MSDLAKSPPRTLAPVASIAEARSAVDGARERFVAKWETVEAVVRPLGDWRGFVKRHPVFALGGAVILGYAVSRLFSRR